MSYLVESVSAPLTLTERALIDLGKKSRGIIKDNKSFIKPILLDTFGERIQFVLDSYSPSQKKVLAYIADLNYHKYKNVAYTEEISSRKDIAIKLKNIPSNSTCFLCKDIKTVCLIEYKKCFDSINDQYLYNSANSIIGNNYILSITFIGKNARLYKRNVFKIYKKYCCSNNNANLTITSVSFYDPVEDIPNILRLRSLDSVICDAKPQLLDTVNKFFDSRELYYKFSINYQLGILLYGAPGCGKTTIVKALVNHIVNTYPFGTNYWFNIGACKTSKQIDQMITAFKREVNEHAYLDNKCMNIVVIEELDQVCDGLRDSNSAISANAKAKINALLQFLDGINSCNNTIVIATTNYLDKLDPALIRDGRFSCKIEVKPLDDNGIKEMCDKFDIDPSIADDMPRPVIPVDLQTRIFNKLVN